MTYPICGKCLHAKSNHSLAHGFMYCAVCFKLCDTDEYDTIHKPTDSKTVFEMSAKKQ